MNFTIYPMLQYPKTRLSNIPVFHYFNRGEVPDLVQILNFSNAIYLSSLINFS